MRNKDFDIAEKMARKWVKSETDPNEVASALTYLNAHPDGKQFFDFLHTVVSEGRAVVRSGLTLDYYRAILQACEKHLKPYQDDPRRMALILGWAVRLMRYYHYASPATPVSERREEAKRRRGIVKWFNPQKGYGFITPDAGGKDLFFHRSQLTGGLEAPADGTEVSFVVGKGPRGRIRAQDVRPA